MRTLAEFGAEPSATGAALAAALAALACRALHHESAGANCADCAVAGRALAIAVGRALFTCRRYKRRGPTDATDLEAIGRALELLETLAGTRATGAPR